MDFSGIMYNDFDGNPKYLSLEQVEIKAEIVDVSAKVTVIQTYVNHTNIETNRCKYCFPVPANGAICGFSMHTTDGRSITGISKAKNHAAQQFEEALKTGNFAGKLDFVTDDIFTISVGCISPQTTVEIRVAYVMTLSNDDNLDETRFQIPMVIGARFGTPPSELTSSQVPDTRTRVKAKIHIQTSGRLRAIISPSHPDYITETKYLTDIGRLSRRRSIVKFCPQSFLDRDFVLVIHADGLDSPRCFAELHQEPDSKEPNTIAIQLTIIPKFDLPPPRSQEYMFVVDRSGSMSGERMNMAKKTLAILLRMLPAEGTFFNIYSFGSHTDELWSRSTAYCQKFLDTATMHVDTMEANYGGTEIRKAVERVILSRNPSIPTAIFILTDGESHDIEETCKMVQFAAQSAPAQSPLRVFTLGIGNTVSTAMCEGIARAGNGVCLFAVDAEHILGKCARLFRAGRTPFIKNVTIDWGISEEYLARPAVVDFVHHSPIPTSTMNPTLHPMIQQVPAHIKDIHAGHRINISAILSLRKSKAPTAVSLHGELDGGEAFNMTIPIMGIQLRGAEPRLSWVHTLVAWRLIQECAADQIIHEDIRKATIIRLGEKYQLVSRYTSFIAIDEGQDDFVRPQSAIPNTFSRLRSSSLGREGDKVSTSSMFHSLHNGLRLTVQNFFAGLLGFGSNSQGASQDVPTLPGTFPSSASSNNSGDGDSENMSMRTFSTLSSLEGSDGWSNWSPPASPHLVSQIKSDQLWGMRSQSPQLVSANLAPEDVRMLLPPRVLPSASPLLPPPPIALEVINLIRLQSSDGSFTLQEVCGLVGNTSANKANNLGVSDNVWATALFIAFIKKQMGSQKELFTDLTRKAVEFLQSSGSKAQEVLRQAEVELA